MKFIQPVNPEERDFCRHIMDLLQNAEKNNFFRFSSFLTDREQVLARAQADAAGVQCGFWGGHKEAVRKMFSAPKAENEKYPLDAVTFFFRNSDMLTHRDFLGSMMSLGIKRNQIGDISVADGGAVVFVSRTILPLIEETCKIGRVGVRTETGIGIELPSQKFEDIFLTVSSLRIDVLVSGICGVSRDKSAAFIKSGRVILNGIQILSSSVTVEPGDIFSVKGYGKFVFSDLGGVTRKGKNHITIKKYN